MNEDKNIPPTVLENTHKYEEVCEEERIFDHIG